MTENQSRFTKGDRVRNNSAVSRYNGRTGTVVRTGHVHNTVTPVVPYRKVEVTP